MTVNPISAPDLLVAFANTGHDGPDELDSPAGLRIWAEGLGLACPTAADRSEDLPRVHAVRQGIRDLLLGQNGVAVDVDLSGLESVALRLDLTAGPDVRAANATTTTAVVLAAVASAVLRASAGPTWSRLKACPGPGCAFVFRDTTRNGSRRWCVMSECGNRAKGAAFRARAERG